MKTLLAILTSAALLAGCVETTSGGATVGANAPAPKTAAKASKPIPEDVYQELYAMGMARQVAKSCPMGFAYSLVKQNAYFRSAEADLYKRGYLGNEMERWARELDKARIQADTIAYIQKRKIIIGEPKTFCAAGAQEIAENTRVGYYLRPIKGR